MPHPFKLTFELQQHTPIIHFQYDQDGATLRATEVKAKLDRYIWKKEWNDQVDKGIDFLVGRGSADTEGLKKKFKEERYRALDYKIQLKTQNVEVTEIHGNIPLYFGNMSREDDQKKEKHKVKARDKITGEILCLDTTLKTIVQKHLAAFFNAHNFGTRQSKGFGSFELVLINQEKPSFLAPSKYSFRINNRPSATDLAEYIDLFYRAIRSGINLKGRQQSDKLYFKSLLFQYAKTQKDPETQQPHQWDKRKMRLDLFSDHPDFTPIPKRRTDKEGTVHYNDGKAMLYRDMLGLSSTQSWFSYRKTVEKTGIDNGIERYKSPLTFKPYKRRSDWIVYLIPEDIPAYYFGKKFKIKAGKNSTSMETPKFNLVDYLDYVSTFFDENNTVANYIGNHQAPEEVRKLEEIFSQLKKEETNA